MIKDRYVILGNHRDAWVFGAVDPTSGTATMMELSRVFMDIVKGGEKTFFNFSSRGYSLMGLLRHAITSYYKGWDFFIGTKENIQIKTFHFKRKIYQ